MAGFNVKAEIIWDKKTHSAGDLYGCPGMRHEKAIFATKGRFVFDGKRPQSLLSVPRISGQKLVHPNEKPVGLMERLVDDYSPQNGTVLDPFMGTGATGIACKNLNRDFIGIELDPEYFKIAESRIKNFD